MNTPYPRDLVGYGAEPPRADWPDGARLAVQFVVNYEEGGENAVLHGDPASEAFLSEIIGADARFGVRHMSMESVYEYGSRAGVWRLLRLFGDHAVPVTLFATAMALERNPAVAEAALAAGHEMCSHGWRWIDYQHVAPDVEREHMARAIEIHARLCGERPLGWYTGRTSPNTRRLVVEEGGFLYDADDYSDDLPHWTVVSGRPHLVVPYTLDANDMRFATAQGFNSGDQFFAYLRDAFDTLLDEGDRGVPKMMSVGLHCRLAGRPGRFAALRRFVEYARGHDRVWFCRRVDIARHWRERHPFPGGGTRPLGARQLRPSAMPRAGFLEAFGGVYERSPWVAEGVPAENLAAGADTAEALAALMRGVVDGAGEARQLALLRAHPDLAGRLAVDGALTGASAGEQANAGLDRCTPGEYEEFRALNARYRERFGFPFVLAVRGRTRGDILGIFRERLGNGRDAEFREALEQVHRIARLRLETLLGED